jgi:hypothetical protein
VAGNIFKIYSHGRGSADIPEKEKSTMDAIIGRYRASIEETGLVLTHPTGISFDLTTNEALELLGFLKVYRQTLINKERETSPELERIVIEEQED